MSLYEQFFSDINKEYMYNMIKNIIKEKINIDISLHKDNYEIYLSSFQPIFEKNDFEDIAEINKILLEENVSNFLKRITEKEKINNDYESLLKQRNEVISNDSNITDNIAELETLQNDNNLILQKETIQNEKIQKEEKLKTITINSSKRTNINSSRYFYKINLSKQNIKSQDIKEITKLILPIENNYLFNIPVLSLEIEELNIKITLQLNEIIEGINRKFGVYKSIENHKINTGKSDSITVDIRDITETPFNKTDILKVNVVQVKNHTIVFTCSQIDKDNFKVGDNIKIINNNSYTLFTILQSPLCIKKMEDNLIYCKLPEKQEEFTYDNIDMKIMNMSNQNILYFN